MQQYHAMSLMTLRKESVYESGYTDPGTLTTNPTARSMKTDEECQWARTWQDNWAQMCSSSGFLLCRHALLNIGDESEETWSTHVRILSKGQERPRLFRFESHDATLIHPICKFLL